MACGPWCGGCGRCSEAFEREDECPDCGETLADCTCQDSTGAEEEDMRDGWAAGFQERQDGAMRLKR